MLKKLLEQKSLLLAMFFIVFSCSLNAQNKTITGKVTDSKDGSPVIGATISVKGSRIATSTLNDGTFSLSVPQNTKSLTISSVGFESSIADISTGNVLNAALNVTATTGTDVVVVGYGTQRKKDLTGAVSSVQAKNFTQGVVNAPDQLIQGKVAGVQITSASGQPGAQTVVRIRGYNSMRSGSGQPLYVIDGVPLDGRIARPGFVNANGIGTTPDVNPLIFINPNDIASIDVLKDASACAIYGSRGANGVMIITTKKGLVGQTRVDVDYSIGFSNIYKKYKVASASDYVGLLSKYNVTTGNYGGSVDAQSAILRTSTSNNLGIAISSSTENSNYRFSLNFQDNQGILQNSGLKKYIATFKGGTKILASKILNLDYFVSVGQTAENIVPVTQDAGYTGSLWAGAVGWNPTLPLMNTDGTFHQLGVGGLVNPAALLAYYKDKAVINNVLAYLSPSIKLMKNLEYKITAAVNSQFGSRRTSMLDSMQTTGILGRGIGAYSTAELTTILLNHVLTYNTNFNKFNVNALVGYEYQKFLYKGASASAQDFTSDAVDYTFILQNGSQSSYAASSFADPLSELQSYFGRLTLNYSNRFLFTGTLRADGSNKFGSNNKYGYFPSVGFRWNLFNEEFYKNMSNSPISNLALRFGWGITGSSDFPAGAGVDQFRFSQGGTYQYNYHNYNLKWEQTKQINAGIEFQVMKRANISIDYFNKNTSNLLFNNQLALPGPSTTYWVNLPGNVINSGLEFVINTNIINQKNFTWDLGFNFSTLKNKLTNYPTNGVTKYTGVVSGQGLSGATSQIISPLINNQSINSWYMPIFTGLNSSGFSLFQDPSGTPVTAANASKYLVGSAIPKSTLGFNTEVGLNKLTIFASGYGAFGHKIFNNTILAMLSIGQLGKYNVSPDFLLANENANNSISVSTRYLEKGNYLKLSNLGARYNLGNVSVFKNVIVSLTGQNLLIITKYKGSDPEVNTNKDAAGINSFGLEYIPYPSSRTFVLGVKVSL